MRNEIDELFNNKVGSPPESQQYLDGIYKEGEERYKNEIPPGFRDEKAKKSEIYQYRKLRIKREYGDLLVWKQILEHINKEKINYVIFITDDRKEDWWWKKKGKTLGPNKLLIEEIFKECKITSFWMYNSYGFIKKSKKYLQTEIGDSTLSDIEEVVKSNKMKFKLALSEYYKPILKVINNSQDGALTVQECINQVFPLLEDKLLEADFEPQLTGEIRWMNNVRWARRDLKELGYLSDDSPRGIWEITKKGKEFIREGKN